MEVGVVFAAVITAIPVFFSFRKTILYDSLAQLLVMASAAVGLGILESSRAAASGSRRTNWLLLALEGFLLCLLLLVKQSTGAGTVLGVCGALFLIPQPASRRHCCLNIFVMMFFLAAFFCLLGAAMSPWVNFSGMIRDVFIIGSEPKGGASRMLQKLFIFSSFAALAALIAGTIILTLVKWLEPAVPWRERLRLVETIFLPQKNQADESPRTTIRNLVASLLAVAIGCIAFICLSLTGSAHAATWSHLIFSHLTPLRMLFNFGLGLSICLASLAWLRRPNDEGGDFLRHTLAPLLLIFLAATMFHTLSVGWFRWSQDNNPLLVIVIACLLGPWLAAIPAGNYFRKQQAKWIFFSLACVGMLLITVFSDLPFATIIRCNQTWPEIGALVGARLRPESAGMRALVETVRTQTKPDETVLLLPDDPNVEAWFDRKRPALSCAIIFTDQYWDRYVEEDFRALTAHPPKVIIIGPRDFWRPFSRQWNVNRGAERLIDLLSNQLLPGNYELRSHQQISFRETTDYMDVYVRRADRPVTQP